MTDDAKKLQQSMIDALRNARRRLLHGMSGGVLNALHNATAGSDVLHEQVVIAVYCEALIWGGAKMVDANTPQEQWAAVKAWAATVGAAAASSTIARCIERLEREVRAC